MLSDCRIFSMPWCYVSILTSQKKKKKKKSWDIVHDTFVIKQTFYLQKVEAPQSYFRYTLLNTQWRLRSSMSKKKKKKTEKRKKKWMHFVLFICIFRSSCFVCNSVGGKWAHWRCLKPLFWSIKRVIIQKRTNFLSHFCVTIPEHN